MASIDASTKLCALIGDPVAHSLSPALHNAAFQAAGLNYVYLAFALKDVGPFLAAMKTTPSFRGVSVTIPHKLAVIDHLDEIDPMAEMVGSVNTISNDGGKLIGSTTDGRGALRALREQGVSVDGKKVLFLGSGGAVRAVAFAVAGETSVASVTILGRTPSNVERLADDLRSKTSAEIRVGELGPDTEGLVEKSEIIINGTPVGMETAGEGVSPINPSYLHPDHVVFDMVYRPHRSPLIQDAETKGCQIVFGIDMLLYQAALQFEAWTGVDAPVKAMRGAC